MNAPTVEVLEEAGLAIASSLYHSLGFSCVCSVKVKGPCTCGAVLE